MTEIYMLTVPQREEIEIEVRTWIIKSEINNYARLKYWLRATDCHKWIIAKETGKGGYKHIQARFRTGKSFEEIKEILPTAHLEKASDTWDYERKEGHFITSEDNLHILKCRYGKPKDHQRQVLKKLQETNDRQILVWWDQNGNVGKSWLQRHLWEVGQAYYVPPYKNVDKIVQFIASQYINHGWRDYIFINIPRSGDWSSELIEALEHLKDGLITEPRYQAQVIDIWGVKVCVCTNSNPIKHLGKLSKDRWVIINENSQQS